MKKPKLVKEGYVVVQDTICQGTVILHKIIDDDDVYHPEVYDTIEDAWKSIASDMMMCLQQFLDGERDLEDTDFGPDGTPAFYQEWSNGEFTVSDQAGNPIIEWNLKEWRDDL